MELLQEKSTEKFAKNLQKLFRECFAQKIHKDSFVSFPKFCRNIYIIFCRIFYWVSCRNILHKIFYYFFQWNCCRKNIQKKSLKFLQRIFTENYAEISTEFSVGISAEFFAGFSADFFRTGKMLIFLWTTLILHILPSARVLINLQSDPLFI